MYDAALGRWHTPDPLSQYYSPYVYVGNNPINMIDPTGMWAEGGSNYITKTVVNDRGEVIYHDDDPNDKNIYYSPDGEKGKDGNTEGLDIIGTEKEGYDYKVGEEIPISHLSDEGLFIFWDGFDVNLLTEEDEFWFFTMDFILAFSGGVSSYSGTSSRRPRSMSNIKTTNRTTVKGLTSKSTPGRATKGKTTQWIRKGGMKQANNDFDALGPQNVKTVKTNNGTIRTGRLSDGRSVTVRSHSSDGRPTLEVRNAKGRGVEFRYD